MSVNSLMHIKINGCPTFAFNPKKYVANYINDYGRCDVPRTRSKRQKIDFNFHDDEDGKDEVDDKKKVLIGKSVLF